MCDDTSQPEPAHDSLPRYRRGFTLATLFLLTVIVATLLAAIRMATTADAWSATGAIWAFCHPCALTGIGVGLAIGLAQPRPLRGACDGVLVGYTAGALACLLSWTNTTVAALLAGGLLLFVTAVIIRLASGRAH